MIHQKLCYAGCLMSHQSWHPKCYRYTPSMVFLPFDKRLHNYGKSLFFMGKSTISMAIFNSFFYVYQAGYLPKPNTQKPGTPHLQNVAKNFHWNHFQLRTYKNHESCNFACSEVPSHVFTFSDLAILSELSNISRLFSTPRLTNQVGQHQGPRDSATVLETFNCSTDTLW